MKNCILLPIILLVLFASCKKDESPSNVNVSVTNDLAYGTHAKQKMDVYLPDNRNNNTTVLVFLHGGGFVAGDKADFNTQAMALAKKGYVVLNVNYRLVDSSGILSTPIVHKPSAVRIAEQLQDIKLAVNFAAAKTSEWKVSNTRWAMAGHSAGATLTLLYSYSTHNTDGRIKVAANWAGALDFGFQDESQFDLLDPRLVEVLYRASGAEPVNANVLAYMAISPYWVANTGKGIATINIRPENNIVIDQPDDDSQYVKFTELLTGKSVPNKYVEVAGADHGFSKPGNWDRVVSETDVYIKQNMQ